MRRLLGVVLEQVLDTLTVMNVPVHYQHPDTHTRTHTSNVAVKDQVYPRSVSSTVASDWFPPTDLLTECRLRAYRAATATWLKML